MRLHSTARRVQGGRAKGDRRSAFQHALDEQEGRPARS